MDKIINEILNSCNELKELLIRKNQKYGNSFFKTADEYGKTVLLLRIDDKLNRLKELMINKVADDMKDENICDTLTDIAGYALLAKIYLEKKSGQL